MARTIHTRDERREQFIKAGLKIARKSGVKGVSGAAVARECSVTAPLIFHNFGSIKGFRDALADAAKKQGVTLAEAAPVKRKRSVAEVKAIKDKVAGKRATPAKKAAKKPAAPKKAVKPAKAPKAVKPAKAAKTVKPAKAPKAVRKARPARAVAAADQPSVSGKFVTMPKPAGLDDNLSPKP